MDKLLSLFIAICFSISANAQIEFGTLIDESIQKQNSLAEEIKASDQLAQNIESDEFDEDAADLPMKDTYSTFVTDPNAVKKTQEDAKTQNQQTRGIASEKEFGVKLKPATGTESALKYFPNLRNRSKKDKSLAKSEALDTGLNAEKSEMKKTNKKKSKKKLKAAAESKTKHYQTAKTELKKKEKKKSRKVATTTKKKKNSKSRKTASSAPVQ